MDLYWEGFFRSVFYSFMFVCGVIGNAFVILFFSSKMKRIAKEFRWFVIHLAIADLIYAIVSPIHLIYQLSSRGKWKLGIFLCKTVTNLGPLTVNVSAWILCLMGYERYRCICHPFLARFRSKLIHILVIIVWIICISLKILTIVRRVVDSNQQCLVNYTGKTEYIINNGVAFFADSILPIIVQTYFLIRITLTLHKRAKNGSLDSQNKYLSCHSNEKSYLVTVFEIDEARRIKFLKRAAKYRDKKHQKNSYMLKNEYTIKRKISNYINSSSLSRKKRQLYLKDKQDRKTVAVFFLTVVSFTIVTLPFNMFYFIVSCLYSYYFTPEDVRKYERILFVINDWLALLVLSGCILNVLIYSGKFPQFKRQIYLWLQKAKRKVSLNSI